MQGVSAVEIKIVDYIRENHCKNYFESFIPEIENFKRDSGGYPVSIDILKSPLTIPPYLKDQDCYVSDGKIYSFSFSTPGSFLIIHVYHNSEKKWYIE